MDLLKSGKMKSVNLNSGTVGTSIEMSDDDRLIAIEKAILDARAEVKNAIEKVQVHAARKRLKELKAKKKSLEEEIIHFCRNNLSSIKCPKTVDFEKELPRHPTGKLYKRLLKDRYWKNER